MFLLTTTYASILPQMKFQDCVLLIMRHSTCKHLRHAVSQPLTPNSFSAIQSDAMSRNIATFELTIDSYEVSSHNKTYLPKSHVLHNPVHIFRSLGETRGKETVETSSLLSLLLIGHNTPKRGGKESTRGK